MSTDKDIGIAENKQTVAQRQRARRQHKAVFKKTLIGGYPGLALTARYIAEYIPHCKTYVEPFAGLGRMSRYVHADKKILNDKSEYALKHLRRHFIHCTITDMDFAECIKQHDSPDTFFFIDPPWYSEIYDNNPLPFCDREPKDYYRQILDLCKTMQGDWMLCSSSAMSGLGNILKTSGYPQKLIRAQRKIFGKNAVTLLTAKHEIKMQAQKTMDGQL